MWRRTLGGTALVLVTLLLASSPAQAILIHDPNDTGGPLDIRKARFQKFRGSGQYALVDANTFGRWKTRKLLVPPNGFRFSIDSRKGTQPDFVIYTETTDGKNLFCKLKKLGGRVIASSNAFRSARGFACSFGWSKFDSDKKVRWRVVSIFGRDVDATPDKGWAPE